MKILRLGENLRCAKDRYRTGLSNERKPGGCLGYIGGYIAQLCGDYDKPL